jgi:exosortase
VANAVWKVVNMLTTDISKSAAGSGVAALSTLWNYRPSTAKRWALGATTLILGLAYAPNLRGLLSTWRDDPNYSHGYLVIPIALYILWQRITDATTPSFSSTAPAASWGWFFLIAVLAIRAYAYEKNFQWIENATILPVIICLTWTFGGWSLLRRIWPAIVFLVFMLPLPPFVDNLLALPLQGLAASGSCFLLQLTGLWAVQEGNVIRLSTSNDTIMPLDVAIACSGLKMLMTLTATVTATTILISLPTWKRICLLLSVVPIALFSNMIRIVVTGWCYYQITGPTAKEWAHDLTGWLLMMPLALALVGIELGILSWLVPEESEDDKPVIPVMYATKKKVGKEKSGDQDLGEL